MPYSARPVFLRDDLRPRPDYPANLPVSAEQLQSVMGSSPIGAIASQLGVSPDLAGKQLADLLPGLVDMLTPNGQLPQGGDLMAQGMDLLKGKLLG